MISLASEVGAFGAVNGRQHLQLRRGFAHE
jgi:hypothetical protein